MDVFFSIDHARDHEDNGPVVIGVSWFLTIFSGAFLGLRLYAKLSRRQGFWWDDAILTLSWVLLLVATVITQVGRQYGMGRHVWTIPLQDAFTLARLTYIGASISCFAATFSKISFGVTLLRLTKGPTRIFVWICCVLLFLLMLPSAFMSWAECRPVAKLWNFMLEGSCWDKSVTRNYGFFNAAFCALVDFALALLPWKVLWGLQLMTKEKIGVGIAMSMGLLAGVCAIVKGVYIQQVTDIDFFYKGKDITIWTAVETSTAIIGASIPILRVFIKNTIISVNERYYRTTDGDTTAASVGTVQEVVPMSAIVRSKHQNAAATSVGSISGSEGLGTVIRDDGRLSQTSTFVVMHSPNAWERPSEWDR